MPLPVQPCAMASAPSALAISDDALGDDGAGKGGAQQVELLILGARFERGEDVILDELLLQVLNVELGGARLEGLFFQPVKLVALADVAATAMTSQLL